MRGCLRILSVGLIQLIELLQILELGLLSLQLTDLILRIRQLTPELLILLDQGRSRLSLFRVHRDVTADGVNPPLHGQKDRRGSSCKDASVEIG